jgi:protein-tyrosine phosphatase
MTFTVLTVCSANICRSPLMTITLERSLFSQRFGNDVIVHSGGANAAVGDPACAEIARLTRSNGMLSRVLELHRSRPLTDEMIESADLILAADRRLRSDVVKRARPMSFNRMFTLREAAQLAATACREVEGRTTDERLRSLTAQMNHCRGFIDLPAVERVAALSRPWRRIAVHTHDVPDAHSEPQAPHAVVHRLIVPAAEQLVACLATAAFGPTRSPSR